ncbi:response regulator transcription factor [Microbacteriaceae bacterium VKM Ac-2854]|nr:response regulator transcription factor [Microbacteriaceae bacterium VKM Ac-2854]
MIRVLLVDDQPLIRMGLRMLLDAEPDLEVVGEAGDGFDGVAAALRFRPDVVLMDVRMPTVDGIEATARLGRELPEARVIVLTTFDLDEYAYGALAAGASGFLLKDARPAELAAAVRTVAAGEAVLSGRVTRQLVERFGRRLPRSGDALAALTEREAEVFRAMAEGLSNGEIAARYFLSESTVKTHVGRVLAKLELRDRVHAVIRAYELGIVD